MSQSRGLQREIGTEREGGREGEREGKDGGRARAGLKGPDGGMKRGKVEKGKAG